MPDPAADAPLDDDRAAVLLVPAADAERAAALLRGHGVDVTVEPPGARLLDAVAVMHRLRSPGGCPWDAEQTHDSLKPYLLEEAYEAYQALEDGDVEALRDELGDVLLQVLFHARVAAEAGPAGWDVDDVAAGLVAKLVRRHPHVFGSTVVTGAADVQANWDSIKSAETAGRSVVDGVPLALPALTLAAKLQSRAARAGLPVPAPADGVAAAETPAQAVAAHAAEVLDADPPVSRVGDLLFAAVALARSVGVDPEAALRGAARSFRDRIAAADAARREGATAD